MLRKEAETHLCEKPPFKAAQWGVIQQGILGTVHTQLSDLTAKGACAFIQEVRRTLHSIETPGVQSGCVDLRDASDVPRMSGGEGSDLNTSIPQFAN